MESYSMKQNEMPRDGIEWYDMEKYGILWDYNTGWYGL
jgi:hypothetical protein